MRSLYWKIFISFWLASILIIVTTAWVSSEITQSSSRPTHERFFMDSYANAAVSTYLSSKEKGLRLWLAHAAKERHMQFYLLSSDSGIIANGAIPAQVARLGVQHQKDELDDGLIRMGNQLISHEIMATNGTTYRLVALSYSPIHSKIEIPWLDLLLRLGIAIAVSGAICYLLSVYLTQPLASLSSAAKSLARGHLKTRVQRFRGHYQDEIDLLSSEFNRMAEQLEQLVNSKERLLQDISHELRSPLTRLQLAIALARKYEQVENRSYFERMERECLHLNHLIGDILEFARLNKPEHTIDIEKTSISDLLCGIVEDARFEFGESSTKAHLIYLEQPEEAFFADVDTKLLARAVENILRNALKYSPANSPVHLMLSHNETRFQIRICDKGPGVPKKELRKIFAPFYRVDTARQSSTGGFGLGLSIASKAIRAHHGHIRAENQVDGGLCVIIDLPIRAVDNTP